MADNGNRCSPRYAATGSNELAMLGCICIQDPHALDIRIRLQLQPACLDEFDSDVCSLRTVAGNIQRVPCQGTAKRSSASDIGYGNIVKLATLVDDGIREYSGEIKGMIDYSVRKAGTAGQRLADLDMQMLYVNLRV